MWLSPVRRTAVPPPTAWKNGSVIELSGFLHGIFCCEDMSDPKSCDHPEQKEQTVVIPNIVCKSLDEKSGDPAEDAKAEGLIDLRYGIFAEGEGALREQEDKETEGKKSENTKLR